MYIYINIYTHIHYNLKEDMYVVGRAERETRAETENTKEKRKKEKE